MALFILEEEDPELFHRLQQSNLERQYGLLSNSIEIGLQKGPAGFDKYLLWALNHVAVAHISQLGGRFRREPIYVGNHKPPHFAEIDEQMDRFVSTVQENWYVWSGLQLAAYVLWRLNWIHPFVEGNGRTARATSYYVLCVRFGMLLPGRKILPERIRETRQTYGTALFSADQAWDAGHLDISIMEEYLASLLTAQLSNDE